MCYLTTLSTLNMWRTSCQFIFYLIAFLFPYSRSCGNIYSHYIAPPSSSFRALRACGQSLWHRTPPRETATARAQPGFGFSYFETRIRAARVLPIESLEKLEQARPFRHPSSIDSIGSQDQEIIIPVGIERTAGIEIRLTFQKLRNAHARAK